MMGNSAKPGPKRPTRGVERFGAAGCGQKRFLDDVGDRFLCSAQQPCDVAPYVHAVCVIQPAPGIPVPYSEAANYGKLLRFIEQEIHSLAGRAFTPNCL